MPTVLRHLLLAAAFLATYGFTKAITPVLPASLAALRDLPMALDSWSGVVAPPLDPEVAKTLAADQYIRRYYSTRGRPDAASRQFVEMDISYYAQPRVGANMHSPLNCLPGNGWQISSVDDVMLPGAPNVQVRALTVQRGERAFAMAYWFQTRDRVVSGELSTRLHLLGDALRRRPTDAGLVRVMAPVTDSSSARDAVLSFASRLVPALSYLLQG